MQTAHVPRILLSSTVALYGNQASREIQLLEDCATAHGLQATALLYFNACGADAEGRSGERHGSETDLIALIIQAAQGQRSQINIYDTPDATRAQNILGWQAQHSEITQIVRDAWAFAQKH